ncbi:MAG: hypothetical protein IKZ87_01260, partial [Actinomycetaceae bacterium]|nr:hypothetical protein [Actinomycetaceae bacterium]
MKIVSCYKAKISQSHGTLRDTVALYREVIDFIINVILLKWDAISSLEKPKQRFNAIEHLIHQTKDNPFPEFP